MPSRLVIAMIAALIAFSVSAQEAVAVLDLKFVRDTGVPSGFMCYEDERCDVWSTYYLFEAEVDEVISGELPSEPFLVLYGQHALRKKNFRNVIALLEVLEADHPTMARYNIVEWGSEVELLCFSFRDDESTGIQVDFNGRYDLNCFERN